ncbi:hypothetical protein LJC06_01485 [Bacteroidales bacterium OttesenSCG-928-I14]|nr:hypothetical protein [Bacteroidales bacterium OttesenSCG-928-I14]
MKKIFFTLLVVFVSFSMTAQKMTYRSSEIVLSEKKSFKDSIKTVSVNGFEFESENPQPNMMKSPKANNKPAYTTPQGTVYLGLAEDMSAYTTLMMGVIPASITWGFAAPFSTWEFWNVSEGLTDFLWEYGDKETTTSRDLIVDVSVEGWYMPTLNSGDESFQFGTSAPRKSSDIPNIDIAYIDASGGAIYKEEEGLTYHVSNACLDYDLVMWQDESSGGYYYGTGSPTEELVAYYDAPAAGYIFFDGIDAFFGKCTGPDDAEFYLNIVKAKRNQANHKLLDLGDVIATSKITIGEIKEGVQALQFRNFTRINSEGVEESVNYFELDESFALVLGGYNAPGVELAILAEWEERADQTNYAFVNILSDEKIRTTQYANKPTPTTMYFELVNGHYSYLLFRDTDGYKQAKDIIVDADKNGGQYNVMLFPYFAKAWQVSETPDWMKTTKEERYNETEWGCMITFDVEPNLSSEDRTIDLEFATWGARGNVIVNQPKGGGSAINDIYTNEVNVAHENTSFKLTYPAGISNVEIYNATGLLMATYSLDGSGVSYIPSDKFAKGVYMFVFTELNKTIKVIK